MCTETLDPHSPSDLAAAPDGPALLATPKELRVWLVEDQEIFRQLLAEYLRTLPAIAMVGNSPDHDRLMAAAAAGEVDLVVLDLMLEGTGGLAILQDLAKLPNGPAVLILSAHASAHAVVLAAELGARGFVEKTDSLQTVGLAIQRIAAGGIYFSDGPRRMLGLCALKKWSKLTTEEVGKREVDLLVALINVLPIKEAAGGLHLSVWSAAKLRAALLEKSAARDNDDLIQYARRIGLIGTKMDS